MEWKDWVDRASDIKRLRARLRDSLRRAAAEKPSIENAELVLTELVSNGLRYGEDGVNVALTWDEGLPVIEVIDRAPSFDLNARGSDPLREGGRGLAIVTALAKRFEVTRVAAGNRARAVVGLNG